MHAEPIPSPKLKYVQLQFLKKFVDEDLQDYLYPKTFTFTSNHTWTWITFNLIYFLSICKKNVSVFMLKRYC